MANEEEIDEQELFYADLCNEINMLKEYFSNPERDLSKLDAMLRLYDSIFEYMDMEDQMLRMKVGQRDCTKIVEDYKSIGEQIPVVLSTKQNGKELGNTLVQDVISGEKEVLGKRFSLLQYVFHKFSKELDIPFQPLYFSYGVGAGAAIEDDDSVALGTHIYDRLHDTTQKNAWAIYTLAHELQHVRQRHANPNGTKDEQLLYLYSKVQALEDGYYVARPSGDIAHHEEFPDEIRADYDACPFAYRYVADELSLPEEIQQQIRDFLKERQVKLVLQRVPSEKPLSPEEYLEHFVETNLLNNKMLSPTERKRVDQFVQAYEQIAQRSNSAAPHA